GRDGPLARQVREERANGGGRGALGDQREVLLTPRRSRDVEVRPRQLTRELPQEERGVDRAAAARADVVEVRDLAFEVLTVLLDQRELPEPLARGPGRLEEALGEPRVIGQEPGAERAERDAAGAGQRRHVDHLVGLHAGGGIAERRRGRAAAPG